MYFPFYYDPTIIIIIPAFLLVIYAQYKVKGTFSKYNKIQSSSGLTGAEVARKILAEQGITDVAVQQINGKLSDHYDPQKKVLNLSREVYGNNSLAALGV